jgi:hypothetical protein
LRLIIVVVQVRAVKIYVAAVAELTKKERHDENWTTTKIGGKTSLGPIVKFAFPDTCLMPYYAKTDGSDSLIARLNG